MVQLSLIHETEELDSSLVHSDKLEGVYNERALRTAVGYYERGMGRFLEQYDQIESVPSIAELTNKHIKMRKNTVEFYRSRRGNDPYFRKYLRMLESQLQNTYSEYVKDIVRQIPKSNQQFFEQSLPIHCH